MPIPTPSAAPLFTGQIRPPDVPAYVPQPIAFATGTNPAIIGDGSATGGFAPYWASQPADIVVPGASGWVTAGRGETDFATFLCLGYGGDNPEAKFRTHSEFKGVFPVDSIRFYGMPGASHMHMFWGNRTPSAFMTHVTNGQMIGDDDGSSAAGGLLNRTGYWMTALLFDKGGITYAISPGAATIYYKSGPEESIHIHPLPNGLRYVSGVDMEYPSRMVDMVALANTDAGSARYRLHADSGRTQAMWHSWFIDGSPGAPEGRYLVNPDGSNPFATTGTVAGGGVTLRLQFSQPLAWDGVNPWSPRGYDHVMPMLYDTTVNRYVPPQGWYKLPTPEYSTGWDLAQLEAFLGGPFYNFNPRLSSDAHLNSMFSMPGKGHSMHTDWIDGWMSSKRRDWENNGIGCGPSGGIPHEMGDSEISAAEKMLSSELITTPDGKPRQVNLSAPIQITEIPATRTVATDAVMA